MFQNSTLVIFVCMMILPSICSLPAAASGGGGEGGGAAKSSGAAAGGPSATAHLPEFHDEDHRHWSAGEVESSDSQVRVPSEMIELIRKDMLEHFHKSHPSEKALRAEVLQKIPRHLLSFRIRVWPETTGLMDAAYEFLIPRGGGQIDLRTVLGDSARRGFFRMKVIVLADNKVVPVSELKTFYTSRYGLRSMGRETFGNRCGQLMNLSGFAQRELLVGGVRLNTTDLRHAAVVGGAYYFYWISQDQLYLGTLSFRDSQMAGPTC